MILSHRIINNHIYQKIVVHRFRLGDVEDPELYAAGPLLEWENSEAGQFVMNNAIDQPEYHQQLDAATFGYQFAITAWLKEEDITYFCLRWR